MRKFILIGTLLACASVAIWLGSPLSHRGSVSTSAISSTNVTRSDSSIAKSVPALNPGTDSSEPGKGTTKERLAQSSDYYEFAKSLIEPARAGTADAQYYLFRVIDRCASDNKMYFQRRGQVLSMGEAQQYAAQRHLAYDMVQTVYQRCHQFLESGSQEFGDAKAWLVKAANAGQPLAEAEVANKLLVQQALQSYAAAGAAPVQTDQIVGVEKLPRELLADAVRSGDPEVLFTIGQAATALTQNEETSKVEQLAWTLVACERGMDCTASGEWIKTVCANDARCASFGKPSDYAETFAGSDWPAVQAAAEQISKLLDERRWDELPVIRAPTKG